METINQLNVGQLKAFMKKLEENKAINDETKIFLDTGWDSLQEVLSDALSVEGAQTFQIQDPLNEEVFLGYTLTEKAEKMQASGDIEKVVVIRNLY
ncbi:hypothetical protein NRIC_23770 [Enterococcus florum]|uniref:Uncharacterized protein n=1 Tax=Enterococcus florum TaxID=2480627 RepID=A0A4P5PA35_9ENTE|nr:hypothetical protein [Enterococcus florum]GCF94486.1 hypothetical protein NRIC_23770 [Enterococcus florum]